MSEHEHAPTGGGPETEPHAGAHPNVPAAEPDRASYPWLMVVVIGFLALHVTGFVVMWLYFQDQSEEFVQAQVLSRDNVNLEQLRRQEAELLTSYGVVNREEGLYRVPLERGVRLYLDEVRAKTAAGEPIRIGRPVPGAGPSPAPGATDVPAPGPQAPQPESPAAPGAPAPPPRPESPPAPVTPGGLR